MSLGAAGGSELESALHLRQSLHFCGSASSSELQKLLAVGRPIGWYVYAHVPQECPGLSFNAWVSPLWHLFRRNWKSPGNTINSGLIFHRPLVTSFTWVHERALGIWHETVGKWFFTTNGMIERILSQVGPECSRSYERYRMPWNQYDNITTILELIIEKYVRS